jgi:hypothetical protein
MVRFGAVAVLIYAGASLVMVVGGLASDQPERAAELPLYIWLGAFCAILLGSAATAFWLSPRPVRKFRVLYSLAVLVVAWLPCAGMFALLQRMTDVSREEFRFASVLGEVRQLDPDRALQNVSPGSFNAPAGIGKALSGPGLVVVREGKHGDSVALWSGSVGRIERHAGKAAELATVIVIYRLDNSLAYAVIDWPHRRTVEWSSWQDIPDRYVNQTCAAPKAGSWPCVALISGGPQWNELLQSLGFYEPPGSLRGSTLITLVALYIAGVTILIGGTAVAELYTSSRSPLLRLRERSRA